MSCSALNTPSPLCALSIILAASWGLYPSAMRALSASCSISTRFLVSSPRVDSWLNAVTRSFISTTSLSAVFLPTPGSLTSALTSLLCTAIEKSWADIPDSTPSAIFGPTPLTFIKLLNKIRSSDEAKP